MRSPQTAQAGRKWRRQQEKKRKEMILTILGGKDLLSMLNGTLSKPIPTSTNPTGYTGRRIIVEANGEDAILGADDVFYYLHDSRRLYIAITIAVSESLQYMFPTATSTRNEYTMGSRHPASFWNNLR